MKNWVYHLSSTQKNFRKVNIEEKELNFSESSEECAIIDSDENKKIINEKEKYDYLNNMNSISKYENLNDFENSINNSDIDINDKKISESDTESNNQINLIDDNTVNVTINPLSE